MNLTRYSDYSLRVLIYVGLKYAGSKGEERSSIQEISDAYSISRNHLVKIVHQLGQLGYLETMRGRTGGIRLGKPPEEIVIGEVVRKTEKSFDLLECFDPETDHCVITPICGLKGVFGEAMAAFLEVLDRYTLAEMLSNRQALRGLLASGRSGGRGKGGS